MQHPRPGRGHFTAVIHGIGASALLLATLALAACGSGPPVQAELAALVGQQDDFHGSRVLVSGTVRGHEDPEHYWLEDADLNRVGLAPDQVAREWLDEAVQVQGRFTRTSDRGRRIDVEQISAAD